MCDTHVHQREEKVDSLGVARMDVDNIHTRRFDPPGSSYSVRRFTGSKHLLQVTLEEVPGGSKRHIHVYMYEYFINIYFGNLETLNFLFILLLIHKSRLAL